MWRVGRSCSWTHHFRGIQGIRRIRRIRMRVPRSSFSCTGIEDPSIWAGKGGPYLNMGAQGTPGRPKESQEARKGSKRSPMGVQGMQKGVPNGAKRSKRGRKLYKLTPDQPQSGQCVICWSYAGFRITPPPPAQLWSPNGPKC